MNEPGSRSRSIGNVFKGGGGVGTAVIGRMRNGKGPNLTNVRLLRAHVPLGVREYLPSYLPEGRDVHCFTFLREPADRTLSHYFAIREGGRSYGLPPLAADATLDDALADGYVHDNLHTRMLSGQPEPFGEVDDAMLEQAKRNLREELIFFGLTERFDESLVLAKRRLGLRSVLYRSSSRVNTSRPRGDEVPADLRRAAARCNRYDLELYRYAQELFESAPERRQPDFEVELAALRAAKGEGEIDLGIAAPAGLDGELAWRMLLQAKAQLLRVEFERGRRRLPKVPATVQQDALEGELKTARLRAKALEKELEELRAAPESNAELRQEIEHLKASASRAEELERRLERTLERLAAASSRRDKLERRVKRLRAGASAGSSKRGRPKRGRDGG
jgi:hypothetical protein